MAWILLLQALIVLPAATALRVVNATLSLQTVAIASQPLDANDKMTINSWAEVGHIRLEFDRQISLRRNASLPCPLSDPRCNHLSQGLFRLSIGHRVVESVGFLPHRDLGKHRPRLGALDVLVPFGCRYCSADSCEICDWAGTQDHTGVSSDALVENLVTQVERRLWSPDAKTISLVFLLSLNGKSPSTSSSSSSRSSSSSSSSSSSPSPSPAPSSTSSSTSSPSPSSLSPSPPPSSSSSSSSSYKRRKTKPPIRGAALASTSSGSGSAKASGSGSGAPSTEAEGRQAAVGEERVTRSASGLLKFGLGLSGLALKMAGDIALDIRKSAFRRLADEDPSRENNSEMPKVDAVEARSLLAADPKDLTKDQIVAGTKKLKKLKTALGSNLQAQERIVSKKEADIADTLSENYANNTPNASKQGAADDKQDSSNVQEKMSTLSWLKSMQESMKKEYRSVMDKIYDMEKALDGYQSSASSSSSSSSTTTTSGTRKIKKKES